MSKKNITRFKLDPKHPPKLDAKEKKRLDAIGDADIDYSDIPELGADFWRNLQLTKPVKKTAAGLRLDNDVLSWFKQTTGKGYQSRINAVLRAYMFSSGRPT